MAFSPLRSTTLACFFSGMALWFSACHKQEMENPLLAPPEVRVAPAATADVPIFKEWIGTLDGSSNAEIRARVSGYILRQNYADGTLVKKGDLLFEIDPRPFEATFARAQADLAAAKAEQLRAELNADKYTKTFQSGATSEKDRDNAIQQNEAAKARVLSEEATVQQAKLNLEFTRVIAPFDGVISIATRSIGDLVGPADPTPLATLSTLDPIRVYFQVSEQTYLKGSERFAHRQAEGKAIPVTLTLANGERYPHEGHFEAVDRKVSESTGTIRIAASFSNPGNRLRPGQFARVRLPIEVLTGAVVIPQEAIEELQGGYQVAVVGVDKTVAIRKVVPGPVFGGLRVIEKGLEAGEQVIVEGLQKVSQGREVIPMPLESAAPLPIETPPANAATQP